MDWNPNSSEDQGRYAGLRAWQFDLAVFGVLAGALITVWLVVFNADDLGAFGDNQDNTPTAGDSTVAQVSTPTPEPASPPDPAATAAPLDSQSSTAPTIAPTDAPTTAPTMAPAIESPGTPAPSVGFPELTPFAPELESQLHEIRDRVSAIRGLSIHPTAEEGIVSREALAKYGRDQFAALEDEDADDVESAEAMLRIMGLIPQDYTFETYAEEEANIIAGVYYFESDRLVLVGEDIGDLSVSDELTLAHEYVHSVQDAKYDLGAFIERWTESEAEEEGYTSYSETLRCLIEGDAELAQRLYAEETYGPNWEELVRDERADDPPIEFDIPEFLLRGFGFYYSDCVAFVEALYAQGGWASVNAAYEDPPGTTEQIISIEKFAAGEVASGPKPQPLDGQLKGWSEVSGGQFGQFDVYNYLLTRTGDSFASILASFGWGSGWIRLFNADAAPSEVAVEIRLVWDAEFGTSIFVDAFDAVLESHSVTPGDESVYPRRWITNDGLAQHGALLVNDEQASVRLIFATSEAGLDALLEVN
jgi:hypothetical protein